MMSYRTGRGSRELEKEINMNILKEATDLYDYTLSLRRHIHEYPEVTGEEVETMKLVMKELDSMGIKYVQIPDGGIVGEIKGGKPGKTVLLRADLDALPIKENPMNLKKQKLVVSKNDGVSHACGHDSHTAMLLTEAKILAAHKDELNGNVVLCFEQGEEGGGQVKNILKYVVEEAKYPVDTCFATHVKWDVPTGQVSVEPGAVFAGAYGFNIRLRGLTGHGSRPDLAHSVLDCFNSIYSNINMLRLKYVNPYDILTFSVGTVQCGSKMNIIPDELTFSGTVRTFNVEGAGVPFMHEFMEVVKHETELHHCTYEIIRMPQPLFECYNNPTCSKIAKEAVAKHLGPDAVTTTIPWMASESMNMYLKLWPGVISFTGIMNEELGSGANHHTAEFDIDEKGMITGVAAAISYVTEFLNYEGEVPFTPYSRSLEDLTERNLC